jgi:hypothetical protein
MWAAAKDATSSNGDSTSLAISIVALAVSAAVAGWNVLKYILDGGRVRVRLERGYLDETALFSAPFRAGTKAASSLRPPSRLHLEVGVVRVENLGRTAVTIYDPSFDLGGKWSWRRFRFGRWTVAPMTLKFKEAKVESVIRIDPFDFALFILDAESALSSEGPPRRRSKKRRLRASVGVAGKRLRRRSGWRQSWRVSVGARTLGDQPTPELVTYRSLFRRQNRSDEDDVPRFVAGFAAQRVDEAWNADEKLDLKSIMKLLEESSTAEDSGSYTASAAIDFQFALLNHNLVDLKGDPVKEAPGSK